MKFMKLGSKPDAFKSDGNNRRYVANELPNDIVVNVVDVKFYMHKFPILSKCLRLQKLMAMTNQETQAEIFIQDIPGGPTAFEICAKYCYGMTVTLNALNVIAVRCAAEYLEMYDTVEKGNLIYKIDVFLKSSIFRGWKDSIIVLQTTKSLLPWSEDIKVINPCLDAIASKASMDTSKVKWSYTYNRKSLISEKEGEKLYNGVRKELTVPKDWWVEDLSDLDMDLYKRVMTTIKTKGIVSSDVISEALSTYASRKLPGFNKGMVQGGDLSKYKSFLEAIVRLLPKKGSVSSSLLIRLLRASMTLGCGELVRKELMRRVGLQLYKASVPDLLVRSPPGGSTIYDVDLVEDLIKEFVMQDDHDALSKNHFETDFQEVKNTVIVSDASKGMVAKLIDCYLAEVSRDPNLPLSKFICISELVKGFPRRSHDGIYRAIDMFLKEHPGSSKSERKKICQLMDCRKLSMEACEHAVQNERLPLRVVIQVLFFEQGRDLHGPTRALHQISMSATTNTEDNWDGVPTTKDLKTLKGSEIANLRIRGTNGDGHINDAEKLDASKVRRLLMSKRVFSKQWSTRERDGEISSSDSSESHGSTSNAQETRLNSRNLQS